jgi:hypothetical protein
MIERLMCVLFGHKYVVLKPLSYTSRKVGCTRCHRAWGMNDSVKAFIPWNDELEEMYKMFEWNPTGLPSEENNDKK